MTVPKLRLGSNGIIELPSLHVTDVRKVAWEGATPADDQVIDPSEYVWFEYGTVQLKRPPDTYPKGFYGGYGYVPGGYLPSPYVVTASVLMTHGYAELPKVVKQVAFELAAAAEELPVGNVKDIQTPGFRLQMSESTGLALSNGQMGRLSAFKLGYAR